MFEPKYPQAEYEKIMKCPECGFFKLPSEDGMPDREDFERRVDEEGVEYVQCPCGCKFVEEKGDG